MTRELSTTSTTTQEYVKSKSTMQLNYNRVDKVDCDLAKTLCARDYKGLCNFGANAAIEVIHIGSREECQKLLQQQ